MNSGEMYKIQYMSGKGKLEVISILQKEGETWGLVKDPRLEDALVSKFLHKDHHNKNNPNMGYGQIIATERLTYITGSFEVIKSNED
jgi:hypothetical protein